MSSGVKQKYEPIQLRLLAFLCLRCGNIQLDHAEPGNCDRSGCHSDDIECCGPSQPITIKTFNGTVDKIVAGRLQSGS